MSNKQTELDKSLIVPTKAGRPQKNYGYDPIASDGDDEKRIKKAEMAAERKATKGRHTRKWKFCGHGGRIYPPRFSQPNAIWAVGASTRKAHLLPY